MARSTRFAEFMRDPDQDARRDELAAFIGPDAAPFLKAYDAMRAAGRGGAPWRPSFVWLAFLLGPAWFLYRKLWVWSAAVVAALVALAFAPKGTGIGFAMALGLIGRPVYVQYAVRRIVALRGDAPKADLETLRRAGGVSSRAGWIAGVVMILLTVAGFAAAWFTVAAPAVR